MNEKSHTFGKRLRELRVARGHRTARQFAALLGINENTYTRYERGQAEPDLATLARICKLLPADPGQLFGLVAAGDEAVDGTEVPGFAETGAAGPLLGAPGTPVRPAREPQWGTPLEAATWRLAKVLVRVSSRDGADKPSGVLSDLAAISKRFWELEREPYRVVARILSDPATHALAEKVQAHLRQEINRFLKALEKSSEDGDGSPQEA